MDRRDRARLLALKPTLDTLEVRQMLASDPTRGLAALAQVAVPVSGSVSAANPGALDTFAWDVIRRGQDAPRSAWGPLGAALGQATVGEAARVGIGNLLLNVLRHHPRLASQTGLSALLQDATAVPSLATPTGAPARVAARPDLNDLAWKLVSDRSYARSQGLVILSNALRRSHLSAVATSDLGGFLARELGRRPAYTARRGLTNLLTPPSPTPTPTPAPTPNPDPGSTPVVPTTPIPPVTPPTGGPVTPGTPTLPTTPAEPAPVVTIGTVALGSTYGTRLGVAGSGFTYTITPQPLPANMVFDRGTGALAFVPSPDQVGSYQFQVVTQNGSGAVVQRDQLTLDVQRRSLPSTAVSGVVVDEAGQPLAGIPVMIGTIEAETDDQGRFTLTGIPQDPGPLSIDGPHADAAGSRMMLMAPTDQFLGHPVYAGVNNVVPVRITLPRVDLTHATDFGALDPSQDHQVSSPALPGVTLHVAAASAMTMAGAPFTGKLALTQLDAAQLEQVLPENVKPGTLFIGVDGTDLMFETPAKITLPNLGGYRPGAVLDLMSMDMVSGAFQVTGLLQVSADGQSLETVDGGIHGSSCIFAVTRVPGVAKDLGLCEGCQITIGSTTYSSQGGDLVVTDRDSSYSNRRMTFSDVGLVTGEFFEDHSQVAYQSQGAGRSIQFEYSSLHADPRPAVGKLVQIQPASSAYTLSTIKAGLELASVNQGSQITYNNDLLDGKSFLAVYQGDATSLSTGIVDAKMNIEFNYINGSTLTTTSASYTSKVNVVNEVSSPYGAGWSIGGLQRIYGGGSTQPALVTAGAQGTERFNAYPAAPVQDLAIVSSSGLQLLSNNGMGEFTAGSAVSVGTATAMVAGDFNADSKQDVAIVGGTTLAIYLANSSGSFTAGNTYTLAANGKAVVTANFTGHSGSILDLAVLLDDGTVRVYTGNGSGGFSSPVSTTVGGGAYTGGAPGSMGVGDFNVDGKPDLAVATTGDGDLRVLPGNGSGGFGTQTTYALGNTASDVAVGDLTGDGKLDLAVIAGTINLELLKGNGSGGFTQTGTLTINGSSHPGFRTVSLGNFRGDGQLSAAIAMNDTQGGVVIVPGSSSGAWGSSVFHPSVVGGANVYTAQSAADFTGDGKPDLVVANTTMPLQMLPSTPDTNQMEDGVSIGSGVPTLVISGTFTNQSLADRLIGPMGDTSHLVRNSNGTFTRTYTDGTVLQFDTTGREISLTDRNGNTTTFNYVASGVAAGALESVVDPVGLRTTLSYNSSGKLSTLIDPAGRVTTFTLDSSGNLTSITDPDGAMTQYSYSTPTNHRITGQIDPRGGLVTVTYDSFGRFASEQLPGGLGTTSATGAEVATLRTPGSSPTTVPELEDYLGSFTDPNGHTTGMAFDTMGHASTVQDALGHTTSFTRDMNGWATRTTDPLSRVTSVVYDMKGNATLITNPDGNTMSIAYDATYNVPTRIEDFLGRVTTFTLDSHGNVTRQTDPDAGHSDFTYNSAGQILTATDRNSHTTSMAYDSYGRLTTITYPGTGTPQALIAYDSAGNVTRIVDELGHATTFTYDQAGRLRTSQNPIEAAAGKVTTLAYDASGNLTNQIDALGRITTYTYDARHRLKTITDPLSHTVTYTYDGRNLTAVTDPLGHTTTFVYDNADRRTSVIDPLGRRTTWTYDAAGQVTQITDANNNTTTLNYDNLGRLSSQQAPGTAIVPGFFGMSSTINVFVTYTYDADNNLTSVSDPLGHTTSYSYDNLNRLTAVTDALSHTVSYGYDAGGNQTSVTDPLGHVTTVAYDARNRMISQTSPTGGGTTTFTYDAHSRLSSLTDPVGNVTSYTYDNADRLTVETDPRGKATTYAYDVVNNLTQVTDRLGQILQYGYDNANRKTTETWQPAGGGSTLRVVTYTYDNANRITGVVDPDSQYAFGYDAANQITSVNNAGTTGLPQVTLTYGYNNVGQRASLADSLGGATTYTYDVRNQLTNLSQSITGAATKLVTLAYDAVGRMTTLARSVVGSGSEIDSVYAYDNANRLTTISHGVAGGSNLASYAYGYDSANRLTSETINTSLVTYSYDNSGQLTAAGGARSETFAWDANGNSTLSGTTTTTGNRVTAVTGWTYVYDDEGNITSKTESSTGKVTTFAYDNRDRMTGVTRKTSGGAVEFQATYTYDALDRRIGVKVDSDGAGSGSPVQTWTLYDGVNSYADFNGSGTLTERYLQGTGVDSLLARTDGSGTTAWYLTDHLGSVRAITNTSGSLIYTTDYNSFGKKINESGTGGDRWGYTGREHDTGTGLRYHRARYFDEVLDRWTQEDPTSFEGGDANLERYVHNIPTDFIDDTGEFQVKPKPKPKPKPDPIDNLPSVNPAGQTPGPGVVPRRPLTPGELLAGGIGSVHTWDVMDRCMDTSNEGGRRGQEPREAGAYIYQDTRDGSIVLYVLPITQGGRDFIIWPTPPRLPGHRIIGMIHTHPAPRNPGDVGPSELDIAACTTEYRVPWIIYGQDLDGTYKAWAIDPQNGQTTVFPRPPFMIKYPR